MLVLPKATSNLKHNYYAKLDSIFSLNKRYDNITEEQQNLLNRLRKPNSNNSKIVYDLQYVSAEFLIDNIDRAFDAWKSPFAKDMRFDDFCEFLLPYKVNSTDRPDFWRSYYYDTFYPYVKFALDTVCRLDKGLVLHHPSIEMNGDDFFRFPIDFSILYLNFRFVVS